MDSVRANEAKTALMAVFRSLRALARSPKRFFAVSQSPSPPSFSARSNPFLPPLSFLRASTGSLSPLSKWMMVVIPLQGPLFLSSPPWMLSQSATPLYFQSDSALSLPKLRALDILRRQSRSFPIKLRFVPKPALLGGTHTKELSDSQPGVGNAESFVNLPNLISMGRLVSGPFLGWMITHDMYISAFVGLGISGATDWLDGYLARRLGINSVVGSYLDPLADKVLIGCVALAMVDRGLLHPGLVAVIVARDVALVGGAVYKRAITFDWKRESLFDFFNLNGTRREKVEPLLISKVNTLFQLVLVAAALLQPVFGDVDTQPYLTYLCWLVASTTVSSTVAYGAQHLRNRSMLIRKNY